MIEVTQADRLAAAQIYQRFRDHDYAKWIGDGTNAGGDFDTVIQAFARHRRATEARAQGLVELLEMMDGIGYKELNLSNYTHDDVCALNNAYVEMQLILTQALATWRRT